MQILGSPQLWPDEFQGRFLSGYRASGAKAAGLALIDCLGTIVRPWIHRTTNDRPRRILLARVDHLGDLLLTLPALAMMRRAFPDSRISLLCRSRTAPLLQGSVLVDDIIHLDPPWSTPPGQESPEASPLRVLQGLGSQGGFDLSIDFKGDLRTLTFMRLAGAGKLISYSVRGGSFLLDSQAPWPIGCHESFRSVLLAALAIEGPQVLGKYSLEYPSSPGLAHLLSRQGAVPPGDSIVITVHPGAACDLKNWGGARFAETALYLVREILSMRQRQSLGNSTLAGVEGPIHLRLLSGSGATDQSSAGHFRQRFMEGLCANAELADLRAKEGLILSLEPQAMDLGQLAQCLAESHLLICNDSGPMHLAGALGTPLVALFGPTNARRFGPLGPGPKALLLPNGRHGFWEPENAPPTAREADCWDQKPLQAARAALNILERGLARGR